MSIWTRFLGRSSVVERSAVNGVVIGSNPTVPAISRRSFLVGTAATAVAVPTIARTFFGPPRGGWPVGDFTTAGMRYKSYERYSDGWTNPKSLYGSQGFGCKPCEPMTAARFREIVEPGLNRAFSETYDNSCQEWEALYGDGVALNSTAHPGSELLAEEDPTFIEGGGWRCINGHPYCNRCASPVELSEGSLEQMMIEIKDLENAGHKIRLDPSKPWFIKPGRRWFR